MSASEWMCRELMPIQDKVWCKRVHGHDGAHVSEEGFGWTRRPTFASGFVTGPTPTEDTPIRERDSTAELDTATQAVLDAAEAVVDQYWKGQAITELIGLRFAVEARRALLNPSRELQLGIILRREMVRHDFDDNTIESIVEAVIPQLLEHMGELS